MNMEETSILCTLKKKETKNFDKIKVYTPDSGGWVAVQVVDSTGLSLKGWMQTSDLDIN
jgi:hypothetical protein